MSIGEKLRLLRNKKTIAEVADAIGVTRSSYVKYERDERRPRDEVKVRIANYYGESIENIFFNEVSTKVD